MELRQAAEPQQAVAQAEAKLAAAMPREAVLELEVALLLAAAMRWAVASQLVAETLLAVAPWVVAPRTTVEVRRLLAAVMQRLEAPTPVAAVAVQPPVCLVAAATPVLTPHGCFSSWRCVGRVGVRPLEAPGAGAWRHHKRCTALLAVGFSSDNFRQ